MYVLRSDQLLQLSALERQRHAEAANRATRLLRVRRWERRAAEADRRARLARTAVL